MAGGDKCRQQNDFTSAATHTRNLLLGKRFQHPPVVGDNGDREIAGSSGAWIGVNDNRSGNDIVNGGDSSGGLRVWQQLSSVAKQERSWWQRGNDDNSSS